MLSPDVLFALIVVAALGGLVLTGMAVFAPGTLRARLASFRRKAEASPVEETNGWVETVVKVARPFSKLSVPEEGWEGSALKIRFVNAGWRYPSAPPLYFAAKTLLALSFPAMAALALSHAMPAMPGSRFLLVLLASAAAGYYLPNLVLKHLIERRQRDIFETIPDALDLLTVCVEAGLSLERALAKVAAEIHIKSLVLAQELQLVLVEMRTGFSKQRALRNFAMRTGVDDIDTLVAMLIQSERFGTSMGLSLRVHSENLRNKRRMLAEETAAKIALKLLFPLIFFIFPVLLIVLVGPAGIMVSRTMGAMSGAK